MPVDEGTDQRLRAAAFNHIDRLIERSSDGALRSAEINAFAFDGRPTPLITQSGIWKPAILDAALSIRTTFTPVDAERPYEDEIGDDGLVRYKYRGSDPNHSDNRALRAALQQGAPLIYFVGVRKGVYVAQHPVWIVGEDPMRHEFAVAVDEAQRYVDLSRVAEAQRAYVRRMTSVRLHQPVFRALVLRAYGETCAMCRLRHSELLDAAHILPDTHPRGTPVVPNGLALCKIHHAAYDKNVLGVRPDLVIEVQPRVISEVDGPMLRYGLQEMEGARLVIPRSRQDQPDPSRLEERYLEFRRAG